MPSRARIIRTRVAIGATAVLAIALGAVNGWGKQAGTTTTTPAVTQPQFAPPDDQTQFTAPPVEQSAPAPMTTQQS